MASESSNFGRFIRFPDFDYATGVSHCHFLIVRMDSNSSDRSSLFGISFDQHAVVDVEQASNLVFTSRNDSTTIELERERCDRAVVPVEIP